MNKLPWRRLREVGLESRPHRPDWLKRLCQTEQLLDQAIIGNLSCHRFDVYDDSEVANPSYVYATRFCPHSGSEHVQALTNEDGFIIIQNTDIRGPRSYMTAFEAHHNAIFDVTWSPDQSQQVVSVSGDQTARLWDFSGPVSLVRSFQGYERSVKCVEFMPNNSHIFATGSRDNSIVLWDIRCPSDTKPINAIRRAHLPKAAAATPDRHKKKKAASGHHANSSVTAIQFQDEHTLISSSDVDGIIKVWDVRSSYDRYRGEAQPKFKIPYPGKTALCGFSSLVVNSCRTRLFACCKDHTIYKFDLASYSTTPEATFIGFLNNSKYYSRISLSPDDLYLASGSSDDAARIWNVGPRGPQQPIAKLEGHEAEVTCVEWAAVNRKLVTCGDDMQRRIWRVRPKPIEDAHMLGGKVVCLPDPEYRHLPYYRSELLERPKDPEHDVCPGERQRKVLESIDNTDSDKRLHSFPSSPVKKMVMSPVKSCSPKKLTFSPRKRALFESPTTCLPNLVLDQLRLTESPSPSSAKKRKRLDWLTTLSRQQKLNCSKANADGCVEKKVKRKA